MEVFAGFLIIVAFIAAFNPIKEAPEDEIILFANVPGIQYSQKFDVKPALQFKEENIVKQESGGVKQNAAQSSRGSDTEFRTSGHTIFTS